MKNGVFIQTDDLKVLIESIVKSTVEQVLGTVTNGFDSVNNSIGKNENIKSTHYSIKEAAAYFGRVPRTMYNWKDNEILNFELVGGEYFCTKEEAHNLAYKRKY